MSDQQSTIHQALRRAWKSLPTFMVLWPLLAVLSVLIVPAVAGAREWWQVLREMLTDVPEATRSAWEDWRRE